MATFEHTTVLLHEAIAALNVRPDGIYVDCTLGGGGHSREILQQLGPEGHLYSFDQDQSAYLTAHHVDTRSRGQHHQIVATKRRDHKLPRQRGQGPEHLVQSSSWQSYF